MGIGGWVNEAEFLDDIHDRLLGPPLEGRVSTSHQLKVSGPTSIPVSGQRPVGFLLLANPTCDSYR
jgi:hypothetical protein